MISFQFHTLQQFIAGFGFINLRLLLIIKLQKLGKVNLILDCSDLQVVSGPRFEMNSLWDENSLRTNKCTVILNHRFSRVSKAGQKQKFETSFVLKLLEFCSAADDDD